MAIKHLLGCEKVPDQVLEAGLGDDDPRDHQHGGCLPPDERLFVARLVDVAELHRMKIQLRPPSEGRP
jgi:hypothetical protein